MSDIAHRDHLIDSPISPGKLDELVAVLRARPGWEVLDLGCGKGELLIRLASAAGVVGAGVDRSEARIVEARRRAAARVPGCEPRFEVGDVRVCRPAAGSLDLVVCMGATGAFGGHRGALTELGTWVRPGGLVLVDGGFWRCRPAPEYLEVLGADEHECGDHASNIDVGRALGLVPLYSRVSSEDEWDHFEGLYLQAVERHVLENPDDPEAAEMTEHIRRWSLAYQRWGRFTLGYGLYLFARPR